MTRLETSLQNTLVARPHKIGPLTTVGPDRQKAATVTTMLNPSAPVLAPVELSLPMKDAGGECIVDRGHVHYCAHWEVDVLALEVDATDMSISDDVLSFMAGTHGGVTLRVIQSLLPFVAKDAGGECIVDRGHVHYCAHWEVDVLALEVDATDMSISDDVLSFMAGTHGGVTLRVIQSLLPFVAVSTINSTGDVTYSAIFKLFVGILIF
ncbi:uncharacterized protein A4U43_C06F13890 [Asparagus officinalis]|uniref:Uncharacterized protein n=1 Tax=Asparagus officinalis TaxID=4686 RepID=A0A5P1ESC4_ASPOF|nr:uncharacterized protein A4U43_C06F13890 [Asparagus officinalis]